MTLRTIQLAYDLQSPGRDYAALYTYIKSYSSWCHLLDSTWLVRTNKTAAAVRDEARRHVDGNDRLVALDVSGADWATTFRDERTEWLRRHL